jgi:hypothetical protein
VLEVRGRESSTDPYLMFLFVMRSPKTREKCTGRLGMFFSTLLIFLLDLWRSVPKPSVIEQNMIMGWAFSSIVQYLQKQKERLERKEISAGTMKNYFQAIKLFCDMADIPISWKKVSRGILEVENLQDQRSAA